MNLKDLHETIAAELLAKIEGLQGILCYPGGRNQLEAPVGFLESSQISIGTDPGTGELPIILTFTLRILLDSTITDANIALQHLLIDTAKALYSNNFGLAITPTAALEIQYESIQDAEALLVGAISWCHELHFGESEWASTNWIPPHTINLNAEVGGPLSEASESDFWEGGPERRCRAVLDVLPKSSTGLTLTKTDSEEL
jgi:hypothetical protein